MPYRTTVVVKAAVFDASLLLASSWLAVLVKGHPSLIKFDGRAHEVPTKQKPAGSLLAR